MDPLNMSRQRLLALLAPWGSWSFMTVGSRRRFGSRRRAAHRGHASGDTSARARSSGCRWQSDRVLSRSTRARSLVTAPLHRQEEPSAHERTERNAWPRRTSTRRRKVWTWKRRAAGSRTSIDRSPAPTEKRSAGREASFQLYSLATPNGVKVTVMFEELLARGHAGARYDAWIIPINAGEQFTSGFVEGQPELEDPALLDRSARTRRVFESGGAILLYLAEKFGEFVNRSVAKRAECCHGCSGRWAGTVPRRRLAIFTPLRAAEDRIRDRPLRDGGQTSAARARPTLPRTSTSPAREYTIADMAIWPWYGALVKGLLYEAAEFPERTRTSERRWTNQTAGAPGRQARTRRQSYQGATRQQLIRRHDASDRQAEAGLIERGGRARRRLLSCLRAPLRHARHVVHS